MGKVVRKEDNKQNLPSVSEILKAKDNSGIQKFNALTQKQQLELVLDTSGRDRVELLYLSDRFASLVQAIPAPEILFTSEEVGMDVALPILVATNHEQFTFLTDMLCWNKDEINPQAIVEWLQILVECGEDKIQDWLAKVDPEWLILILKSLANIYKCDEEGDPPDIPEANNLYTIDGLYYFEFLDTHTIDPLQTILSIFRDEDPDGFRGIMEAAIWTDVREMEIYASHFRQSRLSEWGFPELDEALEVYQYFTPEERKKVVQELEKGISEWAELSTAPGHPIKWKDQQGFLASCLKLVDDGQRTARFSQELVLLANKVQVADGMENLGALENIRLSSKKAMGYVTLGLAELSGADPQKAAELIGRVHTERLFQVGFSQIQDLARKALRFVKQGWLAENLDAIDQLAPPDREILKGLLYSKPKFYIAEKGLTANNYIDFQEPEQVQKCRDLLKRIEQMVERT
jgi:hypothetical protein